MNPTGEQRRQREIVSASLEIKATRPLPVLFDCDTIASTIAEDRKIPVPYDKSRIGRNGLFTLVVPDLVVSEVAKMAKLSAQAVEEAIRAVAPHGCEVVRIGDDRRTLVDAFVLGLRYEDDCQYPDGIYLVQCKNTGAVLFTSDEKLRRVAEEEGIKVCSPAGNDNLTPAAVTVVAVLSIERGCS